MAVPARRLPTRRLSPRRRLAPVLRRRSAAPRPTRRRRGVPFLLFSLVMVAATVVGLVSAQAIVAQDSFRLADLSAEAEQLEGSYGRLRMEVAELSAPDRIVAAARRAGLVLPEEVEILRLPAVTSGIDDSAAQVGPALALKGVPGGER